MVPVMETQQQQLDSLSTCAVIFWNNFREKLVNVNSTTLEVPSCRWGAGSPKTWSRSLRPLNVLKKNAANPPRSERTVPISGWTMFPVARWGSADAHSSGHSAFFSSRPSLCAGLHLQLPHHSCPITARAIGLLCCPHAGMCSASPSALWPPCLWSHSEEEWYTRMSLCASMYWSTSTTWPWL